MRKFFPFYSLLLWPLLFGCSLTGNYATDVSDYEGAVVDSRATASIHDYKLHENGIFIFPHLPVPIELERVESETVVFTTPEFHGGIFTLHGDTSPDTVADFFQKRLPQEGWHLAGRLESETCYMAFKNGSGGSILMQIKRIQMGFKTEVRIFVSEGDGGTDGTRYQSP